MNRDGRRHVMWLMGLGGALVLSGLLVLVGLTTGWAKAETSQATDVVGIDMLLAQPRGYLLKRVTVRGEVMRVWGKGVLALRSHPLRQGLLVMLDGEAAAGLQEGQALEVTGWVRMLCRSELRALDVDLGMGFASDNLLVVYGGDPYVLADEVRLIGDMQ